MSGRSSAYGDNMQEAINLVARSENNSVLNTTFEVSHFKLVLKRITDLN